MLAKENLTALFHDLVRAAMETQRVDASETSEFYLVQLLEAFARPARGDLLDPPLALDYLEACNLPGHARYEKLKRVADEPASLSGERRRLAPRRRERARCRQRLRVPRDDDREE